MIGTSGIPVVVLRAYRNAAELMRETAPACHVEWSLLAAIGDVESNHGVYAGSAPRRDGDVAPPILGPVLDGSADTARILDTDAGRLDEQTVFDRAVGPMQFLPGTWGLVGTDGNADEVADPNNVYDAALSAGRYLCAGGADLSDPNQLRAAVYRYNHSAAYVRLVLALASAYERGTPVTALPEAPGLADPPDPIHRAGPPASAGDPPGRSQHGPPAKQRSGSETPEGRKSGPGESGSREPDGRAGNPDSPEKPATPSPSPPGSPSEPPSPEPPSPEPPSPEPPSPEPPSPEPPSPSPTPSPPSSPSPPTAPSPSPSPSPDPGEPSPSPDPGSPAPRIADISPDRGIVGRRIVIAGTGLAGRTARFDGRVADVMSSGGHRMVVEAPGRPRAGTVSVTVRGPERTASARFTYLPSISSIEPDTGPTDGGSRIRIRGTSLDGASAFFGGTRAKTLSGGADSLTARLPPATESRVVAVTARYREYRSAAAAFTYRRPAVSLDPAGDAR